MNGIIIAGIVAILVLLIGIVAAVYFLLMDSGPKGVAEKNKAVSGNLRAMVASQRGKDDASVEAKRSQKLAFSAATESGLDQEEAHRAFRMDLKQRLRYAQLNFTVLQIRLIQLIVGFVPASFLALGGAAIFPGGSCAILAGIVLLLFPMLVTDYVDYRIEKRFQAFDKDYASLLMSYVSLLKTGLNVLSGLEAAAAGLDEGCLARAEVDLMIDRIKVGLNEEQAISVFGEDINHPEIELFVQALILGRRVGGNLSNTLERLAKQVRKRSQFRAQAKSAIGMEKGSMKAIAGIMSALMVYLGFQNPDILLSAFTNEMGWKITQAGFGMIVFGFYLSKKITNIKV